MMRDQSIPNDAATSIRVVMLIVVVTQCLLSSGGLAAETYWVAPGGDDGGPGTRGAPWATLQRAADQVQAGDTVRVLAGSYAGFDLRTSGGSGSRIRFLADPGVVINADNAETPDGINLEGLSWVRVEGFTVEGRGRAGIRAVLCDRVEIVDNVAIDNQTWGIFTGFCNDLLIQGNETAGSIDEHGIYVSNSGDRPVIRGNLIYDNHANGIHMNGDASQGGDGIISDALVEQNVILDNGRGGGSGINCDGVQGSIIRNNLILAGHATGIALYRIDGGGPSSSNLVAHNTVVNDEDGRWGLTISDGSVDNTVLYNIFHSRHGFRGGMDIRSDSLSGLMSDFNAVEDRFTTDGGESVILTLTEWQGHTGQDASSFVASEAALFIEPAFSALGDYHLRFGSPAVDAATGPIHAAHDIEGETRPFGASPDIGADERTCVLSVDKLLLEQGSVNAPETHESCYSITVGPDYVVHDGGHLNLRTRRYVVLRSGVSVAPGGELAIQIDPTTGAGGSGE